MISFSAIMSITLKSNICNPIQIYTLLATATCCKLANKKCTQHDHHLMLMSLLRDHETYS